MISNSLPLNVFLIGMSQVSDVDFSSMVDHSLIIFSAVPPCVRVVLQRQLPLCAVPRPGLIGQSLALSVEFCLTAMATGRTTFQEFQCCAGRTRNSWRIQQIRCEMNVVAERTTKCVPSNTPSLHNYVGSSWNTLRRIERPTRCSATLRPP